MVGFRVPSINLIAFRSTNMAIKHTTRNTPHMAPVKTAPCPSGMMCSSSTLSVLVVGGGGGGGGGGGVLLVGGLHIPLIVITETASIHDRHSPQNM